MAEKKKETTPDQVSFPSTYSVLTAERILEKFDVTLSKHSLKSQVFHKDTFYHKLMYLPARQLNTTVHYEQCRDIQAYAQQKLIHYLFSGETAKDDKQPGAEFRQDIESKRVRLVDMGKDLTAWNEKQVTFTETFYSALNEKIKAWHETVKGVTQETVSLLSEVSVQTDKAFSETLNKLLLDHAAGIRVPDELKQHFKLKDPIGIVEKAVLSLLARDKDNSPLDKQKMKKLKPPFDGLDKKLKLIIDDVGGINASESAQIESAQEYIVGVTKQFAQQASLITHVLHEYFQRYGKEDMKVDNNEAAFQQGVDEDVAADYSALRGQISGR